MKSKIQIAIAILVIIGAAYWGYNTSRSYHISGNNIMFTVGSGHAVVQNTSSEPLEIEMRSGGRTHCQLPHHQRRFGAIVNLEAAGNRA
jgi:hypothetical protein